jgi:hypothetical protein
LENKLAEKFKSAPGPTEIPNWQSQIIKTNTTVSNQAAVNSGTANPVAVELYNMDKRQRQQIALALKSAGYRVPTTGVFSNKLLASYNDALQTAQMQATQLGQQFSSQFFTNYLANEAAAYSATGGAGRDGTSITEQESIITKANAKNIINKVFQDQLGRSATDEEIAKYTTTFKEKAAAKPTVTTTTTAGKRTKIRTEPGFTTGRAEQYLVDKIAQTDEAKAGQVLDYYQAFMRKLGL